MSSGTVEHLSRPGIVAWLRAAAAYNAIVGTCIAVWPDAYFRVLSLPPPTYPALWRLTGMFILVYAPGYCWASLRPRAHSHIVAIGLFGKVLGPVGFITALAIGELPASFGWLLLTNDVVWWPALGGYVRHSARQAGGWSAYLRGES